MSDYDWALRGTARQRRRREVERLYTRADLVRVAIETLAMVCKPETGKCEPVDPEAVVDGLFDEEKA